MRILSLILLALSLTVASSAMAEPLVPAPAVVPEVAPAPAEAPEAAPAPAEVPKVEAEAPAAAPVTAPVTAPVIAPEVAAPPAEAAPEAPAAEIKAAPEAPPIEVKGGLKVKAPEKAAAPVVDPQVPTTDAEAGAMIGMLLDAAQNGHWTVLAGLVILLLVFFCNKFGLAAKMGTKFVPWFTLGISAAIAIAIGLASGAAVMDSIKLGLLEGGVAIALWELVAKHFTTKKADGTPRAMELTFPADEDPEPAKADPA